MNKNLFCSAVMCAVLAPGLAMFGQGPVQNINPSHHANLASAQASIAHATQKIDAARQYNRERLGGHGQKAKDLLARASEELKLAAEYANQHHK